jgi:mono/diheme cytochrome c family protein
MTTAGVRALLLVGFFAAAAPATSVWDGVYDSDQAMRGGAAYQQHCAACHGEDLRGRNGRALVGDRFWQDWGEDRLSSLLRVAQDTMPRNKPHSLDDGTYADIVAFILRENGFPAGSRALTAESANEIQITRQSGPGPVPNFSLIAVVGCLAHAGAVWQVAHATEPVRTRNPEPSVDEEQHRAVGQPLANHAFDLMDAEAAGKGHDGNKVEVKGLLIRGTPDKINVTSIQPLSDQCEP